MATHQQRLTAPPAGPDSFEADVLDKNLVIQLNESEFEMQISVARRFPRDLKKAQAAILSMAAFDEDTAAEMIYSLPSRSGDDKETIEGPGIRFAEALYQVWGNCRVSADIVEVNRVEKYVKAEGVFFDLETNAATRARIKRGIANRYGKLYTEDMIIKTGNAAAAIARRNAILGGIPKPVYRVAFERAKQLVAGNAKDLPRIRTETVAAFARLGILPDQVLRRIGLSSEKQIASEHIVTLRGMYSALRTGEATKEEMFAMEEALPAPANRAQRPRTLNDIAQHFETEPDSDRSAPLNPLGQDEPPEVTLSLASGGTPSDKDVAYKHGHDARIAGDAKNAIPKDYRGNRILTGAWKAGWEAADDEETADGGE